VERRSTSSGRIAALCLVGLLTSCSSSTTTTPPTSSLGAEPTNAAQTSTVNDQTSSTDLPIVTYAPFPEFKTTYESAFGAEEITALRAQHPEYRTSPVMAIGEIGKGHHLIIEGEVTFNGDHNLNEFYYSDDSEDPDWSLTTGPAFEIDCTGQGGTVLTIRGDPHGCTQGVVWKWVEGGNLWDLESGDPGEVQRLLQIFLPF
jgi:hypothetical protein